MSDSEHPDEVTEQEHPAVDTEGDEGNSVSDAPVIDDEESTGDPYLDKLLSEGILKGMERLDLAQSLLAAFIVMSMGWFAYSALLTTPFSMGEQVQIVDQEALHAIPTISAAWNDDISPIAAFLHALNWGMGDGSAVPFRVSQLFLHMLNAVLVFVLCRRMVKGAENEAIALTGGVLFAVHPITLAAVAPLTERSVLLATFFALLSLVLYVKASDEDGMKWSTYVVSLIAFGLAWSCGIWTWIVPLLVIMLTVVQSGLSGLKSSSLNILGFIVVAFMLIAHRYVLAEVPTISLHTVGLMNEASNTLFVVKAWLLPGSAPRILPEYTSIAGISIPFVAMLIAGAALLLRWPSLAWVLLCPVLVLAGFGLAVSSDAFDLTHAYPIGAGIVCLLPIVLSKVPQGKARNGAGLLVSGFIFVSLFMTHLNTTEWKDEEYYWSMAQSDCDTCFEPNVRLATLYNERGQEAIRSHDGAQPTASQIDAAKRHWSQAESFYLLARQIKPSAIEVIRPLAEVLAGQAKMDEAIVTMEIWLSRSTQDVSATRMLAKWYGQRGVNNKSFEDFHAAIGLYTRLGQITELSEVDHIEYGVLLYRLGDFTNATLHLQRIKTPGLRKQTEGIITELNPRIKELNELQTALQSVPQSSTLVPRIDVLRLQTKKKLAEGDLRLAMYFSEETLRSSATGWVPEDWYQLGHIYGLQGAWDTFVAHWPAPESFTAPWQELSTYCVSQKNWNTALVAMMRRPVLPGANPQAEAFLTLSNLAIQAKDYVQASRLLQGMMQQLPQRYEPWLLMGDVAYLNTQMAAKEKTELMRTCIREAQARGASEAAIQALRDKAGLKEDITDSLAPSIIR